MERMNPVGFHIVHRCKVHQKDHIPTRPSSVICRDPGLGGDDARNGTEGLLRMGGNRSTAGICGPFIDELYEYSSGDHAADDTVAL